MGADLRELASQMEQHERTSRENHPSPRADAHLGHRTNKGFYIIIFALLFLFLLFLAFHFRIVDDLRTERDKALTTVTYLEDDLAVCQESYSIVLEDAQALGKIYQLGYREENIGDRNASSALILLPEESLWLRYQASGLITDTCILTSKVVQTPSDEVEIVIIAKAKGGGAWPHLSLVIDGALVDSFTVEDEEESVSKRSLLLPKGTHHLDIIFDNPSEAKSVTISLLRVGDRTIETDISIIDEGIGFAMFDCHDISEGDTMTQSGAMRFKIERV